MFDGLLCQRLAIRLAVVIAEPSEVLGNTNTCDFIERNPFELREDDFENVGVHRHSSGAVGAIPHTQRYPNFVYKGIECVDRSGRDSFFLRFLLRVGKPLFRLSPICHPIGFFASLGRSEVSRWVPSPALEDLLAIGIPPQASLELKGHNFLSLCLFLNVSHFNRLSTAKDLKMTLLLTHQNEKCQKVRKTPTFHRKVGVLWWR